MIRQTKSLDSAQLAAFLAVIEEGSFERAASRLHVTPSAISQRIKQLELQIGQVMVRRASPCAPTAAGEVLLRYAKQMTFLADQAARELTAPLTEPSTVAVAVNADSLATWFLNAVAPLARDGAYTFELLVDDQDYTAEMLRSGRVLAAVTSEPHPVQGCRVEPLGSMRYVAVASPDYLAAYFPRGVNRAALAEAPTLVFNRKDRLQHHLLSKLTGADLTPPVHWIPSSYGFLTAALSGMGWGLVPATMADEQLASGRLKRLRRDALLDIQLYWQHWRLETPLMRDLTAAVIGASM